MAFPANWFNVARDHLGTPEFYWRPAFRQRYFRWSFITLMLICVFVVVVAAKFWTRLSIFSISWLAIALVFAIRLFLVVRRSHECLHLFLTSGQVQPPDKGSPLEVVLGVAADVSNWALALAYSSIIALLMAMLAILAWH
jgi:di/tricarboxylate transporter